MEFSLKLGSQRDWIPISIFTLSAENLSQGRKNSISVGNFTDFVSVANFTDGDGIHIRGYRANLEVEAFEIRANYFVKVCDFNASEEFVQFRWMQTVVTKNMDHLQDMWSLDNVHITYEYEFVSIDLLQDSFDDPQLK